MLHLAASRGCAIMMTPSLPPPTTSSSLSSRYRFPLDLELSKPEDGDPWGNDPGLVEFLRPSAQQRYAPLILYPDDDLLQVRGDREREREWM